jgi:hypothetical protein
MTKQERIDQFLVALYSSGSDFLGNYAWEWEGDRWKELAACLWIEVVGIKPTIARATLDALTDQGWLDARYLNSLGKTQKDAMVKALLQQKIPRKTATAALNALIRMSQYFCNRYEGRLQKMLRAHGERLVNDLAKIMTRAAPRSRRAARSAATLFAQNACNLPVLLSGDGRIRRLCSQLGTSERTLVDRADVLGLNVSVLDDLLDMVPQPKASRKQFAGG